MKSFIFYTGEGITVSPNNSLCENFQVLGFEEALSKDIALETLLKNNSWIYEYGFSQNKIICKEIL
ncbi:MAG: hypothetical protein K6A42_04580 [Treponema sp.]|nr:hypothetical protein [Treponema sp.]